MTKIIDVYRVFRTRLRKIRGSGLYTIKFCKVHTYICSIIFCKTVIYRQIHEKSKPFKPIIVTYIYVILIRCNLEIFISIIHNVCLLISSLILKQEKNCDVRFFYGITSELLAVFI